jgi:8-oxo-dGTP pyrophosphatase MutT (NUDIX family)
MVSRKLILPAVAAIVFNPERQVLLQRRTKSGKWGLISGHVEFGESVEQAVIREIKEETGLRSAIKRLIGIYSSPETQTYAVAENQIQYVTHYFEVNLLELFEDTFRSEETCDLRFFSPKNLPNNLILMHPTWLTDALQNEKIFIR